MRVYAQDKRLHQRKKLYYYLEVQDLNSNTTIGRLVDIHVAGLLLITPSPLETEQRLNLHILIDQDLLEPGQESLVVQAVVRWCKQDINPDYYVAGLQFLQINPEQEKVIESLVRTIGFRQ
jgi:c-di-GMP-binding flagellar brake protein YcgR